MNSSQHTISHNIIKYTTTTTTTHHHHTTKARIAELEQRHTATLEAHTQVSMRTRTPLCDRDTKRHLLLTMQMHLRDFYVYACNASVVRRWPTKTRPWPRPQNSMRRRVTRTPHLTPTPMHRTKPESQPP